MTDVRDADGQGGSEGEDGQADDRHRERSNIDRRRTRARSSPSPAYLNRRRELIDAAARVMSRKGVTETTLGDIAREAGTDRASVYYYVTGKEELLPTAMRLAASIAEADRDMVATMREDWDATSGTPVRDARRLHLETARLAGYAGRATADGIAARRQAVLDRSREQRG